MLVHISNLSLSQFPVSTKCKLILIDSIRWWESLAPRPSMFRIPIKPTALSRRCGHSAPFRQRHRACQALPARLLACKASIRKEEGRGEKLCLTWSRRGNSIRLGRLIFSAERMLYWICYLTVAPPRWGSAKFWETALTPAKHSECNLSISLSLWEVALYLW